MNLVLRGLFLQVIVSIVQFQHGSTLCSAGEPGYLDFDNLPETNFSCQGKVIGGYYADVEAGCQMFHVCTIGQKDEIMDIKFLCLNGTVFDQETRVCERVDEVDCSKSERFYNLNLELYGNNAVTLSLHDTSADDEDEPTELIDEPHESQRTTSSRPSTTSTTTTTTQRPIISSTTSASGAYQHPNGYPQHYQPQPRFPSIQTGQSKSLYDDKNGGYHHQYIYHTGDHRNNNLDNNNDGNNNNNNQNRNNNNNNNQATSYQLFSNQGVGSTTGNSQIHQIRYSSTPGPQIQIRNDHQPTVSPIFHATSSTIQTLLNSNANSPALINPIFHSHGIASTTEQFTVHNNNPRETDEYQENVEDDNGDEDNDDRRPLEPIQPTAQGKVSKLKISSIAVQQESVRTVEHNKDGEITSEQRRITTSFLPTPNNEANDQAVRSFYPTPRTSTKSSSSHVTQHIHIPPPPSIPQLKPHQVTINLSPPDIQRIVQNPSPLLPSQSRVIVTAKASVSDESGRSLNTTQLVTLPLPTIPASYDDYKEGDESFDPFYRDVPKIRNNRKTGGRFRWPIRELRKKRSARERRDVAIDKIEVIKMGEKLEITRDNRTEESEKIYSFKKMYNIEELKATSESDATLTEDMEDLGTMSSRHELQSNSQEKLDTKDTVDSREIYEEEYVDAEDTRSKSIVDGGEADTEEYVNPSEEIFDGKIFDEAEAKTSKEIDTRAVARDSKYSRDRHNNLGKGAKKSKDENSKGFESTGRVVDDESSRFSLELPEVIDSTKSKGKHSSKMLKFKEQATEEEEEMNDEAEGGQSEFDEERDISGEENFNDEYYYDSEMDRASLRSDENDSVEYSKESSNRINSSRHDEFLNREKVFKHDDHKVDAGTSRRRDKGRKFRDENYEDDYDFPDDSTTRSNEEEVTSLEMSSEYTDGDRVGHEDSREIQDDEEDVSMSRDYTTMSQENNSENSQETTDSTEKSSFPRDSNNHEDSDGVLKFTDEIPTAARIDEPVEVNKSVFPEETPQDYIDDNYEPQSYKEKEEYSSTTETGITGIFEELATLNTGNEKHEDEMSTTETTSPTEMSENKKEEKQNDEPQLEKKLVDENQVEKSMQKSIDLEEVTSSSSTTTTTSTTTVPTATTSTTTPTTSTRTTITTTTTTTPRPTPPKLFKPFTLRKSYVYVPPSTTPVPVIIKPRLTLLNPKPAKPLKSYNDYAPKPIIRKSPLFARKIPTTLRTTTPPSEDSEIFTEIPVPATKSPEENIPSAFSRQMPTTEISESSSTTVPTLTTTRMAENLRIEENNVSASSTQIIETPPTMESQTFTPYPLLRMTEAFLATEKILANDEKVTNEEIPTGMPDLENNYVPSVSESGITSTTLQTSTDIETTKYSSQEPIFPPTEKSQRHELFQIEPTSESSIERNNIAIDQAKSDITIGTTIGQTSAESTTVNSVFETTLNDATVTQAPTLASVHTTSRKSGPIKRIASFNCLEKEMYRFYADSRDCRLFHYCSPGFTSRQVLDFRFVCEEGTAFDEESQSCVHDVKSPKCRKRVW